MAPISSACFKYSTGMYRFTCPTMQTAHHISRMHKSICAYPTKALYNDKLISDASVADHLLIDLAEEQYKQDADYIDILGSPVVFFDTSGCEYFEKSASANDEGSKYNENEGTLVKSWLESLVCNLSFRSRVRQ